MIDYIHSVSPSAYAPNGPDLLYMVGFCNILPLLLNGERSYIISIWYMIVYIFILFLLQHMLLTGLDLPFQMGICNVLPLL